MANESWRNLKKVGKILARFLNFRTVRFRSSSEITGYKKLAEREGH
jgi:hypothetical protein